MEIKVMGYMAKGTLICFVLLLFTISGCVGLSSGAGTGQALNKKAQGPADSKKAEQNKFAQTKFAQNENGAQAEQTRIEKQSVLNNRDNSGLENQPVAAGGRLADLTGYQPVRINDTHVPFSRKYKKEKNKHHVELAFDNADIYEVLDATLFDIYGVNYIVDPHIRAKVTFHFKGDYSEAQFVELLNNVLQMDNLSIVKGLEICSRLS